MSRPEKIRNIWYRPQNIGLKPIGIPARIIEKNILTLDQLEALRLADLEGKNQEEAAKEMDISRATFGRIVSEARRKVADALINGKGIFYGGGNYQIRMGWFNCDKCDFWWRGVYQAGIIICPQCKENVVHKVGMQYMGRGFGRGRHRHGQKK